jgi:hypothetical protein
MVGRVRAIVAGMRRHWLDLSPRARGVFALAYLLLQLGVLSSGSVRADRVFGFQMFNASSRMLITLSRRVRDPGGVERVVPVEAGAWEARDARGDLHVFRWNDRVRNREVGTLDRWVHAKDGVEAQRFHLRHALQDVVAHLAQDAETVALIAHLHAIDNGRPRPVVQLDVVR